MAQVTEPEYISPYVVTTSGGLVLDRDVYTMPVGAASILQNFEPSVKIIEIPLGSKTCSVIDNPANHLEINPFQLLDNSQRIGFSTEYDSFSVQNKFPKSLIPINLFDLLANKSPEILAKEEVRIMKKVIR